MKKIVALMIVAAVMVAIVGCSKKSTANQTYEIDDYTYLEEDTEEFDTEGINTVDEENTTEAISEEITEIITSIEAVITAELIETDPPTENLTEVSRNDNEISSELKEFLDSYEAFIDEYCEFMQKYSNADAMDMLSMLADYTEYVAKLTEMEKKLNAYDSDSMTTAEALYYSEVILFR